MSTVEVSTLTSLYDLATQVRTLAEGMLAATEGGTPAISYTSPSRPAHDCCDALIVWVPNLQEEGTSPLSPLLATGHRTQFGRVNLVTLYIEVLRCSPTVGRDGLPLPGENEAVSNIVLQDAWALWTGFYQAIEAGEFKSQCQVVHWDIGRFIPDSGGCVGWQFQMRPELNGIL